MKIDLRVPTLFRRVYSQWIACKLLKWNSQCACICTFHFIEQCIHGWNYEFEYRLEDQLSWVKCFNASQPSKVDAEMMYENRPQPLLLYSTLPIHIIISILSWSYTNFPSYYAYNFIFNYEGLAKAYRWVFKLRFENTRFKNAYVVNLCTSLA